MTNDQPSQGAGDPVGRDGLAAVAVVILAAALIVFLIVQLV
jgi:hypothetical protein